MKTLPEVRKVRLTAEQQLSMLLTKLKGHKVFGRCRGEFGDMPLDRLLKSGKPPSPSATRRAFNRWASDQVVMLDMLAQFKRDGYGVAFEELRRALCEQDRVITGETIPVEQTEPGVLIMPDPEKTLLILRWIYTTTPEDACNRVKGKFPKDREPCGSLSNRLFDTFPGLIKEFDKPWNRSFQESPVGLLRDQVHNLWTKLRSKYSTYNLSCMRVDPHRVSYWKCYSGVAIFIEGKTQAEVLSHFSRVEQERMATWRFDYPKVDIRRLNNNPFSSGPDMWIGLHPESEHQTWQRQWPSYVSKGVACGHGAVILGDEGLGENGQKQFPFQSYNPLRAPYPQFCQGDLMSQRLVIGFDYGRE